MEMIKRKGNSAQSPPLMLPVSRCPSSSHSSRHSRCGWIFPTEIGSHLSNFQCFYRYLFIIFVIEYKVHEYFTGIYDWRKLLAAINSHQYIMECLTKKIADPVDHQRTIIWNFYGNYQFWNDMVSSFWLWKFCNTFSVRFFCLKYIGLLL